MRPIERLQRLLRRPPAERRPADRLLIDGEAVPITFRQHGRARRVIMRMDRGGEGIVLTLPPGASQRLALDFAAGQASWIRAQRRRRQHAVAVEPAAMLPYRGVPHRIEHRPGGRGAAWIEAGDPPRLCVAGLSEHIERRVEDWLRQEARRELSAASRRYAAAMGARFTRLTLRDTSSRWGSCSSSGALSYSWRLILAPPEVLDYVAAHEVAHLVEMNHSKAFWSLVERHCPHARASRQWLKAHGASLHRYGARGGGGVG